ncbi:hypothetical protein [Salinilacihabitans rarus]|uniref:hypothetical protein n=1 Tax=Salinilacihabitans rarus TaxID=2961596 RepID=UPI0020C8E8EC|nr:hypothetical protein [Salinilacihabitans rarus]
MSDVKQPEIRPRGERTLEIWDPIERSTIGFGFPDPVDLEPAPTEDFHFPVESAVRFETSTIECESICDVHVWTADGEFVSEVTNGQPLALPDGEYLFDVTGSIKTYFRVDSSIRVLSDDERTSLLLGDETEVELGIRSFHDRPASEITVPDDPYAMLEAVSYFGDSLQTLSPERSFPSLRGHPPRVNLGDELAIPDGLSKPDSGITLQLPPSPRYLYPATPLAYYLGAEVVPGSRPKLVSAGAERSFDDGEGEAFDRGVAETLQQVFFLDCVTRTEGYYQIHLHERDQLRWLFERRGEADELPDFAALYEAPIDERVARYLEVPFGCIKPLLPTWRLTADVQPDPEYVESLPYLAADLAIVRCPDPTPLGTIPETPDAIEDFFRSGAVERESISFVDVPGTDSIEQAFVGDSNPIAANKATIDSFEARLDRVAKRSGEISVAVVVNDERMHAERDAVRDCYSALEHAGSTVEFVDDATTEEIRELLHADIDFLHYIGHVTGDGISCPDGHFDTTTGGGYGVDAFILNGCQSYRQGEGLVDGGCVGGVVTASEVMNDPAVEIGATFARLLTDGFSLRAATEIASRRRIVGNQYLVIGDGGFRMAERVNTTPLVCQLERYGDDEFELTIETFPNSDLDIGGLFTPHIPGIGKRYLNSGTIDTFDVSKEQLKSFFSPTAVPVEYGGELLWSDELPID